MAGRWEGTSRQWTKEEKSSWLNGYTLGELAGDLRGKTLEQYWAELEDAKLRMLSSLRSLTPKDFFDRRLEFYEPEGYNLAWALYHVAEDEVHHRGQISILRKLYEQTTH